MSRYQSISAAHLTGQEKEFYFPIDSDHMTPSQKKACDERTIQEMFDDGDGFLAMPSLESHIYPYRIQ